MPSRGFPSRLSYWPVLPSLRLSECERESARHPSQGLRPFAVIYWTLIRDAVRAIPFLVSRSSTASAILCLNVSLPSR